MKTPEHPGRTTYEIWGKHGLLSSVASGWVRLPDYDSPDRAAVAQAVAELRRINLETNYQVVLAVTTRTITEL